MVASYLCAHALARCIRLTAYDAPLSAKPLYALVLDVFELPWFISPHYLNRKQMMEELAFSNMPICPMG
jgi:hypothetical protein